MIKYPQLQDKSWLQDQVISQPLRHIAKGVGCSYSGVVYAIRKHGLTVPHRAKYSPSPRKSATIKAVLKKRYPHGRYGENAANWKGGRHVYNGYVVIYSPGHPRATNSNRVFEHIVVAEKKLGRFIGRDEIVHHINGDKQDNRPDNLEVMKRSAHVNYHMKSGKNIQELLAKLKQYEDKYGILTDD